MILKTRRDLARMFGTEGFRLGAEIGVWRGEFSEVLCKENPGMKLLCVDPWTPQPDYIEGKNKPGRLESAYQEARSRLANYNCVFIRKTSAEAAKDIPDGSLDFVYIDANHLRHAIRADLELWVPKVRVGGIVSGHDYTPSVQHIQVKDVVDEFVVEHCISPLMIFAGDPIPSFAWEVTHDPRTIQPALS